LLAPQPDRASLRRGSALRRRQAPARRRRCADDDRLVGAAGDRDHGGPTRGPHDPERGGMMAAVSSGVHSIADLFAGRRFGLTYYQREYAWSRAEVRALLADLAREFDVADS